MNMKWRHITALALAILLTLSLSACGGSGNSADSGQGAKAESTAVEAEGFDTVGGGPAEEAAPEEAGASGGGEAVAPQDESRKRIVTVHMEAETREYDGFLEWLNTRLAEAGGYTENSEMYAYDEHSRSCQLKLRVPADRLDGFLAAMGENCNVLSRSVNEEDVTLSYVDAQSYRDALRVEQERLLELLEQAQSLEDILSLEDRLTTVRYQLQNYESTLRVYDSQINYSTVHLELREVRELTEPAPESWGSRAWAGMRENARDIVVFFQELGLFVVTHLPTLVLLAAVAAVVLLLTAKRRRQARESKRQQKELLRAMQQSAEMGEEKK